MKWNTVLIGPRHLYMHIRLIISQYSSRQVDTNYGLLGMNHAKEAL